MTTVEKVNANQDTRLDGCNVSDGYTKYVFSLLTSGAILFAETFECFWFLDVIESYRNREPFQVWKITRKGNGCVVTMDDGNENILITQKIPYTDFPCDEGTLWLVDGVIMLPSEY